MSHVGFKQVLKDTADEIEDKAPELAKSFRETDKHAEQTYPCVAIIVPRDSVGELSPVAHFEFPQEGDAVVRFRPGAGETHTETREKVEQFVLIDVNTSELNDHAVALMPDGLSMQNLARNGKIISEAVLKYADVIVLVESKRLTETSLEAADALLHMLSQLPMPNRIGGGQIPLIYLHQMQENSDPNEDQKIRSANQEALAGLANFAGGFQFYSNNLEEDSGYKAFVQKLTEIFGKIRNEHYNVLRRGFAEQVKQWCAESEEYLELLRTQRNNRCDYDKAKRQRIELDWMMRWGKHSERAGRELKEILVRGKHDLLADFKASSNGSATIYSVAMDVVKAIGNEADADTALYKINRILADGFTTSLVAIFSRQNAALEKLGTSALTTLSEELENLGLPAVRSNISPIIIDQTPIPQEIKEINPQLPSGWDQGYRYVIAGVVGKSLIGEMLLAAAVEKGIEIGLVAGSFGTPLMMAILATVGAICGLVATYFMISAQRKRSYENEFKLQIGQILREFSEQAAKVYDEFATAWHSAMADNLTAQFQAADQYIQETLTQYETLSNKTPEELDSLIADQESVVESLERLRKRLEDLELEVDAS